MFYIINKITAEVNNIIYTPIGYMGSQDDSISIDNFNVFNSWYETNLEDIKTETIIIEDWLIANPTYSSSHTTEVEPIDLPNLDGGI